ncbi:MAG: FHA domain-containing protein [Rhodospirillales bacterium]|nr:FHA domain-containing protein [Rhodospirillales bacterium]
MNAASDTSLAVAIAGPRWAEPRRFTLDFATIGARGAWIGRAADCAIVLEDRDRYVSLYHARLHIADGQIWLTDQSTNGTILLAPGSGAETRLGKGETRMLAPGARFRMGMFEATLPDRTGGDPGFAAPASPLDGLGIGGFDASDLNVGASDASVLPGRAGAASSQAGSLPVFATAPAGGDPFDALLAEFGPVADAGSAGQPAGAAPPVEDHASPANQAFAPLPAIAPNSDVPNSGAPNSDATGSAPPPPAAPPSSARPSGASSSGAPSSGASPAGALMLDNFAAEVVDAAPVLRPPAPARDPATTALAAFWCGLGIIPRTLRQEDLVEVMAELGAALREAADGLAGMARALPPETGAAANPFAAGHGGLRRHLEARQPDAPGLDDAARDLFALLAAQEGRVRAATRESVQSMAQSLSPAAIEARIGGAVTTRRPRARRAELWRIFSLMQEDLAALAELRFHKEKEERIRHAAAAAPLAAPRAGGTER